MRSCPPSQTTELIDSFTGHEMDHVLDVLEPSGEAWIWMVAPTCGRVAGGRTAVTCGLLWDSHSFIGHLVQETLPDCGSPPEQRRALTEHCGASEVYRRKKVAARGGWRLAGPRWHMEVCDCVWNVGSVCLVRIVPGREIAARETGRLTSLVRPGATGREVASGARSASGGLV